MNRIALKREADRWYRLKPHPVQLRLIRAVSEGIRFPVVPAGRRSGKTERFKRFLSKQAMIHPNGKYFAGAPTRDQAKRIFWEDLKLFTFSSTHARDPSESELKLFLPNGSTIQVLGLDEPRRIEGVDWTGGGIDEIADLKSESLESNIMPALNTVNPMNPDYRAWCWFLGVPDGLNHYYDMAEYAKNSGDKDWALFHWKSSDILPTDVIEAAKRKMSKKQYLQEYEASFETATGRIYEDYGPANYTTEKILPHEQLLWFHDFNFTPMSSGIGVVRNGSFYLLDEIILASAVAKQSALEFVDKFREHQNKNVLIYGDPSGRVGEKHGHVSNYIDIEKVLATNNWKFERRVKPSIRSIRDGQNAVRAKIKNAAGHSSLFVNTTTAPYTHKCLSTLVTKEGSSFIEQDGEYQHIGSAIRYVVEYEWPVVIQGGSTNMYAH